MKSKYFKVYSLSEEGKKNIIVLANLSDELLEVIFSYLNDLKTYQPYEKSAILSLAEKTGESAERLRKAVFAADTFAKRMGELDDSAQDLYSDLVSLNILSQSIPQFLRFLEKLSSISKKYYLLYRATDTSEGGVPNLSRTSMTVALKPVFDKDFVYGTNDIMKYSPQMINFAAVAHISIERDDCSQVFPFQVKKADLDKFITDLIVLQKQLIIAEQKIK